MAANAAIAVTSTPAKASLRGDAGNTAAVPGSPPKIRLTHDRNPEALIVISLDVPSHLPLGQTIRPRTSTSRAMLRVTVSRWYAGLSLISAIVPSTKCCTRLTTRRPRISST